MRSRSPRDGSRTVPISYLNDVNGDVEQARGTLDLLLEIEEGIKKETVAG